MSNDLEAEIIKHQRENEWFFCASVFCGGADWIVQDCAWLRPDLFIVPELGKFWGNVLDNKDPLKSANVLNLFYDLTGAVVRTPDTSRAEEYARAIAEDYFYLTALKKIGKIVNSIAQRNQAEIIATLDELRSSTMIGNGEGNDAYSVAASFEVLLDRIQRGEALAVRTNIPRLDAEIGGFFDGEITILASRPGVGKSAIVAQVARNVCLDNLVLFFSLEMSQEQLWARMACPLAGAEWEKVRIGDVDSSLLRWIKIKSDELKEKYGKNLVVVDNVYMVHDVHRICAQRRPRLVVIDQLSEFIWHDPNEKRVIWYGKAVKYLRHYVAKSLHCPVVLVHQINRGTEIRENKRPMLADLRDSGEVEQRADVVLLCYREDQYSGRADDNFNVPFEIIVAKNRQGNMGGIVTLNYDLKQQWFD